MTCWLASCRAAENSSLPSALSACPHAEPSPLLLHLPHPPPLHRPPSWASLSPCAPCGVFQLQSATWVGAVELGEGASFSQRRENQGSVPVFILVSGSSVVFTETFLISFLLNQIYKTFLFLSLDVSVVFQCWQVCRYLEVLDTFIREAQRSHYI